MPKLFTFVAAAALTCTCSPGCFAASETSPRSRFFDYSSSIRVAYDVQGSGAVPVVLLHSLAGAKEIWDPFTPGFLSVCNCRVYRVDLKGHGDTSAPDDHHYSVRDNSELVTAFMLDQKLEGAILIGHSYGGAVALNTALDAKTAHSGLIRALVLIGAPGIMQRFPFIASHHRYETYGQIVDHVTTPTIRAFLAVHAMNYGNSKGARNRVAVYRRLWGDADRNRAARETARQFVDGGGLKELAARDHDTGVPTLLITGQRDNIVGVKRTRELSKTIAASKVVVIPRAGHSPEQDNPEAVIPVIAEFVSGVPARARPLTDIAASTAPADQK